MVDVSLARTDAVNASACTELEGLVDACMNGKDGFSCEQAALSTSLLVVEVAPT